MTSTVLSCDGIVLVVDPGYFPRELDELLTLSRSRGEVTMLAFTHGHWDHAMGWRHFAGAEVLLNPALQAAIAEGGELIRKNLVDAEDFDRKWYIERYVDGPDVHSGITPPSFPPLSRTRGLADATSFHIGSARLCTLHLPGHSIDGLGLWSPDEGLLLVGDYLSPCEIPFIDDLASYRATLRRLIAAIENDVRRVLPGHGRELDQREATAIAEADLDYLDALADCAARKDPVAAQALKLPRLHDSKEMQEHHPDNCRAAGLTL